MVGRFLGDEAAKLLDDEFNVALAVRRLLHRFRLFFLLFFIFLFFYFYFSGGGGGGSPITFL
eukprot:SAG31_NODE_1261_length_9072_cov_39.512761_1_plen_62_part_00